MLWPIQVMALLTRADLVTRNRGEWTTARARAAAERRPAHVGPRSLARPHSPFSGVPALLRVRWAQGSQEAGRPNQAASGGQRPGEEAREPGAEERRS